MLDTVETWMYLIYIYYFRVRGLVVYRHNIFHKIQKRRFCFLSVQSLSKFCLTVILVLPIGLFMYIKWKYSATNVKLLFLLAVRYLHLIQTNMNPCDFLPRKGNKFFLHFYEFHNFVFICVFWLGIFIHFSLWCSQSLHHFAFRYQMMCNALCNLFY